MRLFIAIASICILGCAGGNDSPFVYPRTVGTGTFYGFDVYGQYTPKLAMVYSVDGQMKTLDLEINVATTSEPLYPGNHISITMIGPTAYVIKKEE